MVDLKHAEDLPARTFRATLTATRTTESAGVDDKAYSDLGWTRITEAIAERCTGDDAREIAVVYGVLEPGDVLVRRRSEVAELIATLDHDDRPPLRGIESIRRALLKASKQDVLLPDDLLAIARTAAATHRVREYFIRRKEKMPGLGEHAERLQAVERVGREILGCFDPGGKLHDDASPDLGRLRRRVQSLRKTIQERLDNILKADRYQGILQDEYVTIRDERYVVPVRAGERGDFPGIVHGQSNTGATLFIEPQELIGLNNDYRIAQLDVQNEERRILESLTRLVMRHHEALDQNQDILTYLDLTTAMALLGVELDMTMPRLAPTTGNDAKLDLRDARHPVLALREKAGELEVVPNDIRMMDAAHVLVVSGPNTGGKTVTLKTIGLFVLMTRAGLAVPCQEGSVLPVFEQLFSDIGDEQTVERDLSTFSGHVRNIARFLPDCDDRSLVLLDELFAGTDPEQGAALGRSLLTELARRGTWAIVTTHLETLKTLAFQDERFACASVGFDVERLEPNYRLRVGVPGSSYALRIAHRLGLSPTVVERAEGFMQSTASLEREQLIERLEREHALVVEEREALKNERRILENDQRKLERRIEELSRKDRALVDKEAKQMRERVRELERMIREQLRVLRDVEMKGDAESLAKARKQIEEARRVAREATEKALEADRLKEAEAGEGRVPATRERLEVGTRVFVKPFAREGTIAEVPTEGERLVVQLGAMRASFGIDDLDLLVGGEDASEQQPKKVRVTLTKVERNATNTLDLRGKRVDEAVEELEAFIDRAARGNERAFVVIHGHGTGALKRAVREQLATLPYAIRHRAGRRDEGGDGVTVVEFDPV